MSMVTDQAGGPTKTGPAIRVARVVEAPQRSKPGPVATEKLARPWRLGIIGLGISLGLVGRLMAANGIGDLVSDRMVLTAALASAIVGAGLILIASERDRFGGSLLGISIVTAAAFGALNWISPPFPSGTTTWDNSAQTALALLGIGNGLLLAGIITLAFVRRSPTLTVATTLIAAVLTLAANTLLLREEWPAIVMLTIAFAAVLLAWDRSPSHEPTFAAPAEPPRISRAALSLAAVALCGTGLQLWLSRRPDIPRPLPAVLLCVALVAAAFVSLMGVRREIERRETTLSEWTSWMREIRTNKFRAEIENFTSDEPFAPVVQHLEPEAPRALNFPNLSIPPQYPLPAVPIGDDLDSAQFVAELGASVAADRAADDSSTSRSEQFPTADRPVEAAVPHLSPVAAAFPVADQPPASAGASSTDEPLAVDAVAPPIAEPEAATPRPGGAFSSHLPAPADDVGALEAWLANETGQLREQPMLVAIEAMPLDRYDALDPQTQARARDEIAEALRQVQPTADVISSIDGPYFIVAHASLPGADLSELNQTVLARLQATIELPSGPLPLGGTLALLRASQGLSVESVVDDAVRGLIQARQLEALARSTR